MQRFRSDVHWTLVSIVERGTDTFVQLASFGSRGVIASGMLSDSGHHREGFGTVHQDEIAPRAGEDKDEFPQALDRGIS